MGQRMQIYLAIKDDNDKTFITGIHHQWCYGGIAALKAIQVLEFQKRSKGDTYNPLNKVCYYGLEGSINCLKALYQVNMEQGFFSNSVHYIGEKPQDKWEKACVKNPRCGDNNDGITIFDFTDPKNPTYCLMNIFEQDKNSEGSVHVLPFGKPVSVEEYLRAYDPIGGTEYQKKNWNDKTMKKNEKKCKSLIKRASKFKVMTQERAIELFPGLYDCDDKNLKETVA